MSFLLVSEHTPGPSSQVLPSCRVRHPLGFEKGLVRSTHFNFFLSIHTMACKRAMYTHTVTHAHTHAHAHAETNACTNTQTCGWLNRRKQQESGRQTISRTLNGSEVDTVTLKRPCMRRPCCIARDDMPTTHHGPPPESRLSTMPSRALRYSHDIW